MNRHGNRQFRTRPLTREYWRPAAQLGISIVRELGAEPPRSLDAATAVFDSPWLEDGEGLVLTDGDELVGYGWAREMLSDGRNIVHTGLFLSREARTPDRYRVLTDPLMRAANRIARERGLREAMTFYRSIDTIHPPIVRAIGFHDLPRTMIGFRHDLARIPDCPPPAGITVRPADLPAEIPAILDLAERCFACPDCPSDPLHADYWNALVPEARKHPEVALVAEEGGRKVGYIAITVADAPPGTAQLHEGAVDPDCRNRGIGSHLACRALQYCRRRRLRRVVTSEPSDSPANTMLWRLGFRPDAVHSYYYFGRELHPAG